MSQTKTEKGRIASGGMGGFLNPPTHPEHMNHVETDLQRRPENRGIMSLTAAAEATWLDPTIRGAARRILQSWQAPALETEEIQAWVRQVLGYFRGCYRGPQDGPECWHAGNLRIDSASDPMECADLHAGVHFIRQYYPDFVPTAQHFAESRWGQP